MILYCVDMLRCTVGHVCALSHVEATLKAANAFGFNSADEYVELYPGKFNMRSTVFNEVEYLMPSGGKAENYIDRRRLLFGVYSIGDSPRSSQSCAEAMVTPKVKEAKDCYQTFRAMPNVNIWFCEDWMEK